jgi:hypothetical protein
VRSLSIFDWWYCRAILERFIRFNCHSLLPNLKLGETEITNSTFHLATHKSASFICSFIQMQYREKGTVKASGRQTREQPNTAKTRIRPFDGRYAWILSRIIASTNAQITCKVLSICHHHSGYRNRQHEVEVITQRVALTVSPCGGELSPDDTWSFNIHTTFTFPPPSIITRQSTHCVTIGIICIALLLMKIRKEVKSDTTWPPDVGRACPNTVYRLKARSSK